MWIMHGLRRKGTVGLDFLRNYGKRLVEDFSKTTSPIRYSLFDERKELIRFCQMLAEAILSA